MGLCSFCHNITDQMMTYQEPVDADHDSHLPDCDSGARTCDKMLPNGLRLKNSQGAVMIADASDNVTANASHGQGLPIITFTAMINGLLTLGTEGLWVNGTNALECDLSFCVYNVEGGVFAGKFQETWSPAPIDISYRSWTTERSSPQMTAVQELKDTEKFTPVELWGALGTSSMRPKVCQGHGTVVERDGAHDDWVYTISAQGGQVVHTTLAPLLRGNTTSNGWGSKIEHTSPTIEAIFGNGSIESVNTTLQNLATELTKHWRGDSLICKGAAAYGQTQNLHNVIRVHWVWMILPCVVVASTIAFFVWVVISNRGEMVWKSSPLPLLFFGLDSETREIINEELNGTATISKLEERAAEVKVHYNQTNHGLCMTTTQDY